MAGIFARRRHIVRRLVAAVHFVQCLTDFEQQLVRSRLVRQFFPVDDAIDEVDRFIVARIWQQDAAIQHGAAALVDEFRLETDRRLVGDDLHVMVGDAAQQGSCRNIRKLRDFVFRAAFPGQFRTQILDRGIVHAVREIEQHRMGPEIIEAVGFEVFDGRIVAIAQQAGPVIVRAHLHAAVILAYRRRRRFHANMVVVVEAEIVLVREFLRSECAAKPVHRTVCPRVRAKSIEPDLGGAW